MAIVFTSPKKKQRFLLWIIIIFIIFVLFAVFLIAFPFELGMKNTEVFMVPDVKINFDVFNSNQVNSLETFEGPKTDFDYTAVNKNGSRVLGKVSALTESDARNILGKTGLTVIELKPVTTQRSEPFTPY